MAFAPRSPGVDTVQQNSRAATSLQSESNSGDDVPNMDWLTDSLSKQEGLDAMKGVQVKDGAKDMADDSPYVEQFAADAGLGDAPLPSTGVSVADEMYRASAEAFFTELVPVIKGLDEGVKVAQIATSSTKGSFEPVRYLVGLSKISTSQTKTEKQNSFVMIDVPPYSKQLEAKIKDYLGTHDGLLSAMLLTNRDSIHYNEAPGVYSVRSVELKKWREAFANLTVVAYRIDIPRDCRDLISQSLDGYGPFALNEEESHGVTNLTFIESGRPLTYVEWDEDIADNILAGKEKPPDDEENENESGDDEDLYTPEAIRAREEGRRVLGIYTPGRTFGSVSYVFPEIGLCASGFTIPIEDSRNDENMGMGGTRPALDFRGYISTSKAGIGRQMESSRYLIKNYIDRFNVLLPSKGDPVFLDGSARQREKWLLAILQQYEKVGSIYEQLGITGNDDDDFGR